VLKFVPVTITVAPTAPLSGVKAEIVGDPCTLKFDALLIVMPLTVMAIGPVVAPDGTVVVILVDDDAVTIAEIPLKVTELLAGVVLKFVPEIVTVAPTAPLAGVNPVKVGVGDTVKLFALKMVMPFSVKEILPVVAPIGTVVVILVTVEAVTVAATPLKVKMLSSGKVLKFEPLMITVAPTAPFPGLKLAIEGVGETLKLDPVAIVIPFTVIDIGPETAPAGTLVAILDVVDVLTEANVPLNEIEGVVMKFVPVIVTAVPTAPLAGLKPVTVGVGNTVKLVALEIVTPLTVTEILPVVAPTGTLAVMLLVVDAVTVADVLLNFTTLLAGVVLKFVPEIMTVALTAPLEGLKPVMVGVANTVKLVALKRVTPLTVTEILPVVAPIGTVVVMLVFVDEVTTAVVLLNFTM
jgi:hypothetical protein